MNIAIILSGGSGSRMQSTIPKQYIEIKGEPLFINVTRTLERHGDIDSIVIVAHHDWHPFIENWLRKAGIRKFAGFAEAGESRQHSVLNGLRRAAELGASEKDLACIFEAARPFTSPAEISAAVNELRDNPEVEASVPVVAVKDTTYISNDGISIDSLPERKTLWNALIPECAVFGKLFSLLSGLDDASLASATSTVVIAFKAGMNVHLVKGDDHNYKVTTTADLQRYKNDISK